MMHKGKNLLDYEGDPTDFRAVGRFLVKLIHDDKQRQDLVFSPRKSEGHNTAEKRQIRLTQQHLKVWNSYRVW